MAAVSMQQALVLSSILFALGLIGVLVRRNVLFMLISVEIMLNATGLAFIAAGARFGQPDGQIMFMLILALAGAEVSVGLALILLMDRRHETLDADALSEMKG